MRNITVFTVMTLLVSLILGQGCPPQSDINPDSIAPTSMGGTMDVAALSIPAGQTTVVTSDLVVNASGDVKIDGQLTAQPTEPGAGGCTITINAGGNIEITGSVQAGNGTDAATPALTTRVAAAAATADPGGTDGGGIELIAQGNITIGASSTLTCGSGGTGADGDWGGAGGKGGDLVVDAGGTLTMRGIVYVGNGGHAGFSMPTVQAVQSLDPDQEMPFGATGGSSGFIFLRAGQVDWPSYDPATHSLDNLYDSGVGGGHAGNASSVNISSSVAAQMIAACKQTTDYQVAAPMYICPGTSCKFRAPNGVDSFILGGLGGSIDVEIDQLEASQWNAPALIVYAGNGGNLVQPPSYKYKDVLAVLMRNGWGGDGGNASARAASGHDGTALGFDGGNGGDVTAYGGNGGSAASITYSPQHGGMGGYAVAVAGAAGHGYSDPNCGFVGGNGGSGGAAYAYGGDGGNGWYSGRPGDAGAFGGAGGWGGVGQEPGSAGNGGGATAASGDIGQYNTDVPGGAEFVGLIESKTPGADGFDGIVCGE